jgi:hypothetical protein
MIQENNMKRRFAEITVKNKTLWSESIINSFRTDSLLYIKDNIIHRNNIYKSKTYERFGALTMRVPTPLARKRKIKNGQRFDLKYTMDKKLFIYFNDLGQYKISNETIYFPSYITNKKLIKENDDTLIIDHDDKLEIKSFYYLQ